ncbi:esterase family protein [Planosporangium thailandense]|uniref:Esterase family protein n=1 Tax=Planosporangium thailandense TaxID=765197 RepID=A0ABX0Y5F8_9ACTN|nr:esterase family protein [Planosporangium thailandense]
MSPAVALCLVATVAGALLHGTGRARPAGVCSRGWDRIASVPDASAPDGERRVWIHHPAGTDRADLPVLYLLHGYPGDPEATLNDQVGALDAAMCRTGVPFVVAAPDGRAGTWDTEWGDDASGRFALESFLTGPVIQQTEGNHRRSARLRAIAGFSMGGYGAAVLALRHPDLYSQVASFGGYFHADDPDGVFGADSPAHAPDRLVSDVTSRQLRFFLVEGADEDTPLTVGSIHGEADRFAAILTRHSVNVTVVHPPGGHGPDGWYPAVSDCVAFLNAGWRRGQ